MGNSIRRFIPRAARYTLRSSDRHQMRFCFVNEARGNRLEETILLNLSETGAGFLVDPGHEPSIGEQIKVEIPIPNGDQIAWFGRVVRVEEYEVSRWTLKKTPQAVKRKILVGIRFENLPAGHSRNLQKGIELSFLRAAKEQQYKTMLYYKTLLFHHAPKAFLYLLLTIATLGFIYYFSLPDEHYDSKRGAPWGERFK